MECIWLYGVVLQLREGTFIILIVLFVSLSTFCSAHCNWSRNNRKRKKKKKTVHKKVLAIVGFALPTIKEFRSSVPLAEAGGGGGEKNTS
jgi:hypothetical protein